MWQDVRYGIRTLMARPGFTLVTIVVLALGIGTNSGVFSLVNAFLLKPLLIEHPEELAGCYSRDAKQPDNYRAFSYPNYIDLRDKNPVFVSLMAHNMAMIGIKEGDTTRRAFADIVSSNYFQTFGVSLFKGRSFTEAEEQPGANSNSVIVSYNYWRKTGSDPGLLGKTLRINGRIFTIVGIAPRGFTGATALVSSEVYLPLGVYTQVMNDFEGPVRTLADRGNHVLLLVGRLRPGLTLPAANSQLVAVASQLEKAYPGENKDQTFLVRPLSRMEVSNRPNTDSSLWTPAILLLSMSGIVLLIASLNVANMMLARGASRRKEIAIRLAIGGGRSRIVRQLFIEGLILAVLGGAAGLLVASWSTGLLVGSMTRIAPIDLVYSARPDTRVLAATLAFCLASTVLFSLGPAWKLSRPDVVADLKKGSGDVAAAGLRRLFSRRNLLVIGQLSLSLMMLAAAGLFVRSAIQAANVTPGFTLDNTIVAEVDPGLAGYDEIQGRKLYSDLLTRLRALPGVESAALAATIPFGMTSLDKDVSTVGAAHLGAPKRVLTAFNIVAGEYFKTLGIPLLRGRPFTAAETASTSHTHVAVVDKLAAERFWPGENPIGKHLRFAADRLGRSQDDVEVVGVAGNVQERIIGGPAQPHLYVPFGRQYQSDMQVHLRMATPLNPATQASMLEAVRNTIRAVNPHLPVLALRSFREHLDRSLDLWIVRTGARMLAIFGTVALLLAVAGLYGVKAYAVAQRTREIGIRMALGAAPSDTLRMILQEGLLVTIAGVAIGIALALALGKVLAAMLYHVHAIDPLVFLGAPLLLTAVSLFASYLPARRAAHIDPMVALRYE